MQDGRDVLCNHILAPICRHSLPMQEQSITHMYTCSQLSNQSIQLLYHHIDIYTHHHHHHSASYKTCIQYMCQSSREMTGTSTTTTTQCKSKNHTGILCARAARKQTITSSAATPYYHHHHIVLVTIMVTTCIPRQKRPPPHGASYNAVNACIQYMRHSSIKRPPPP